MQNKYPYTDFSQLNLDWFLQEFQTYKDGWNEAMADITAATTAANDAATLANGKAALANDKAILADNAATNANGAALLAEGKAGDAELWAGRAETATTNANNAATLAGNATSAATNAANAANAAAAAAVSAVGVLYIPATISGTTVTCSATDADIFTALTANKAVVVRVGTDLDLDYYYLARSETLPGPGAPYAFTFLNEDGDMLVCSVLTGWSHSDPDNTFLVTIDAQGVPSAYRNDVIAAVNAGKQVYIQLYQGPMLPLLSPNYAHVFDDETYLPKSCCAFGCSEITIAAPVANEKTFVYMTDSLIEVVTVDYTPLVIIISGGTTPSRYLADIKSAYMAGRTVYVDEAGSIFALHHFGNSYALSGEDAAYFLRADADANGIIYPSWRIIGSASMITIN